MKHPLSKLRLFTLACGLSALSAALACSEQAVAPDPEEVSMADLVVSASVAGLDINTLVVEVTAADIASPLVFNIEADTYGRAAKSVRIPVGVDRLFTVSAYNMVGDNTHTGSALVDVAAGNNPPVQIQLHSKGGVVPIEVTVANILVQVAPTTVQMAVGDYVLLAATVQTAAGEIVTDPVSWATLNPGIAALDGPGFVRAAALGTTYIVATYDGVGGSAEIEVGNFDQTWYTDADADGWGDTGSPSLFATDPGAGWARLPADCNDADAGVHPVNVEPVDGVDNDCDGSVDEPQDSDWDGLLDADEFAATTDPLDPDSDEDTFPDGREVHLFGTDPLVQDADNDGDGIPNVYETNTLFTDPDNSDSDGDGAPDGWELIVMGTNPAVADADSDGDRLPDVYEEQIGTDKNSAHSDGDFAPDGIEVIAAGTDPLANDPNQDQDGLPDVFEDQIGTSKTNPDTDGDGLEDGDEILTGTDPLVEDSDGDGLLDGDEVDRGTNPQKEDTDGDGVSDGAEVIAGTDPLDPLSF